LGAQVPDRVYYSGGFRRRVAYCQRVAPALAGALTDLVGRIETGSDYGLGSAKRHSEKLYSVAGQVAEQLGWLSDPNLIQQYQRIAKPNSPDFRHWLAQLVIARTKATVLQDSNIMEITYTGTSPDDAKAVADALRTAYIDQSLAFHRNDALKTVK
jgi:hypothetical protein